MKKMVAILLSMLLLASLLAGCGGSQEEQAVKKDVQAEETKAPEASEEKETTAAKEEAPAKEGGYKIGLCFSEMTNALFADIQRILEEKAQGEGNQLIVRDAHSDANSLVQAIEDFISADCQMIIIQNFAGDAATSALQKARDAGICICSWDYALEEAHFSIINDETELGKTIGRTAGQWITDNLDGKAEVAICNYPVLSFLVVREEGIVEGLKETAPDAKIVNRQSAGYANEGFTAGENFLQKNPNVQVVVGINDGGIMGVYEAFKAAGKSKDDHIGLFGCDASADALAAIQEDDMYVATITTKAKTKIVEMYDAGLKAVMEGKLPEENQIIYFDKLAIYKDNIDEA
ncbi:MAG: sugar ABC transporter substrate-binding protein [Blautia sp.]